MSIRSPAQKTWRRRLGERGSVLIEFALVTPILVVLLMGILELGMAFFVMSLLEASVREASRYGITGRTEEGMSRADAILAIIEDRTIGLVDMTKIQVDTLVYPNFGAIGTGETYVDGNANGAYDDGETFTDSNSNGVRDADVGVPGVGGSGDIVLYRIRYNWELLTPFTAGFIGKDGKIPISASVAVRNEPWGTTP